MAVLDHTGIFHYYVPNEIIKINFYRPSLIAILILDFGRLILICLSGSISHMLSQIKRGNDRS